MRRTATVIASGVVLLAAILVGCVSGQKSEDASTPSGTAAGQRPTLNGLRGIMTEKLVHVHALLEAVSLQSFARVERHADALTELSLRSDWEVHRTLAYGVFSEEFREVTRELSADARAEDETAVADGYIRLVRSCLDCHDYLRREGLVTDPPGRVTMKIDR